MTKNIHYFSSIGTNLTKEAYEGIGLRGKQAVDLAQLGLPILPGFIIDAEVAAHLENVDLKPHLKTNFKKLEKEVKKVFNDPKNPMLVKIVISPNLAIVHYPALHNYGLTDKTIPGFNTFVGEDFGYHEILFMIKGFLEIELKIAVIEKNQKKEEVLKERLEKLSNFVDSSYKADKLKEVFNEYRSLFPKNYFSDGYVQLEYALKQISKMLKLDDLDDEDAAILIQPMVYGNYGTESASGSFYTRNIVTGADVLEGWFNQNVFDTADTVGKDINNIAPAFLKELRRTGKIVEDHYKEIRYIRFNIENKKVWLIEQRPVMTKSTQADIKTLLDLHSRKLIDDEYLVKAIKPDQLNEILHPVINVSSIKGMDKILGGISGAPGAAIGRLYFTTEGLIEAYRSALQKDEDTRLILCMSATFAEDVKAIEVATGVLSCEGGYSAHASVVARQYGKVSLVKTDMKIRGKKAIIGDITLNEGDYVTLNVPHYGDPQIYLGKAQLIEPDHEDSGLLDYVQIVKKFVKDFHVRVNADSPRDSALAIKFGAEGIGLCRTEHMFFDEKRINVFREMILADSDAKRKSTLSKLKKMQFKDFYEIFDIMNGKEVTVRLLDAPLHEFLPHNEDEMKAFVSYLRNQNPKKRVPEKEVIASCDALAEFNPMLGHRGCRIAVSYPEIYQMQMEAVIGAAYKLREDGKKVSVEVMIPLIMNEDELRLIMYGKKIEGDQYLGLVEAEATVRKEMNVKGPGIDYKIGTMIELPAAALSAGEIARYAEFFSFGTNDLTQTTLGLSRDDFNSFMPDYTQFDILSGNPFQKLDRNVMELIVTAVRRGKLTRPGLKKGLCGEHGAVPENIKFCMDVGLDYVSCSAYSVPIAILAVAQFNLGVEIQ
ncbi:MAG: pyruvate, phosphate dikinase [Spirochaetales bacterium]|nr:pyruvate, phosphate dikinase [Spirochaetales bacterium]